MLNNFLPVTYEAGSVRPTAEGSRPVDVSDRKAAIEGRNGAGGLTLSVRPERIRFVAPDSDEATVTAKVVLVEPLGAKDVIHMHLDGIDVRTVVAPAERPPDRRQPRSRLRPGVRPHLRRRHRPRPEVDDWRRSGWRASPSASGRSRRSNGVSFDVKDGEFFAILGPPGAGKTTTLRTIVGLEAPEEGDVYLDDERVTDAWPGDRDISIVFQNLALYPDKTVYNNLAFPLKQRKVAKDEIKRRVGETAEVLAHRAPA